MKLEYFCTPWRHLVVVFIVACGDEVLLSSVRADDEKEDVSRASMEREDSEDVLREVPLPPVRPRVAIMQPVVSVDGAPRGDLAAALVDSLADRLLSQGTHDVLDLAFAQNAEPTSAPRGRLGVDTGRPVTDIILVPTVIAAGGTYRLTIRKIRWSDGAILAIARETITGGPDAMEKIAARATAQLIPPPAKEAPRVTYIRSWTSPSPTPVSPEEAAKLSATDDSVPRAIRMRDMPLGKLAAIESAKLEAYRTAALCSDPVKAGTIASVDPQWSFCIITCDKDVTIQTGDRLMTWNARAPDKVFDLRVTRIEGRRIVADFQDSHRTCLAAGDSAYLWAATNSK